MSCTRMLLEDTQHDHVTNLYTIFSLAFFVVLGIPNQAKQHGWTSKDVFGCLVLRCLSQTLGM